MIYFLITFTLVIAWGTYVSVKTILVLIIEPRMKPFGVLKLKNPSMKDVTEVRAFFNKEFKNEFNAIVLNSDEVDFKFYGHGSNKDFEKLRSEILKKLPK